LDLVDPSCFLGFLPQGASGRFFPDRLPQLRGKESVLFEYAGAWLDDPGRFSLQPALAMTRGAFAPPGPC